MSNLEKYVRDHLDEFDSSEPEGGHFKRFEDRLAFRPVVEHDRSKRWLLTRVAAVIILVITGSVFLFEFATREIRERFAADQQGRELPVEISDAVKYYTDITTTQMAELHKIAANKDDANILSDAAMKEIRNLDATTEELRRSLAGNPGNEQIQDAIIRNQRMKETMLNTIIARVSQVNTK